MSTPDLENVEDVYSLTPMQQGMLFHAITDPTGSVFVNQMMVKLRGSLNVEALGAASRELVARHGLLRTAFLWDGLEQPLQVVRERAELEFAVHDWSSLDDPEREQRVQEFLDDDRRRGFDLANAPLTRVAMIKSGPDSWLWVWTTHHVIADGWSLRVMLTELFSRLGGEDIGETQEAFRFRDFVAFQQGRDSEAAAEYWRVRLAGFANPHRLDVPGLPASGSGHRSHSISIDKSTSAALREFAREQRITLNTVFLGAWALTLARWMRTQDVVFGVTTSGRDGGLSGVEQAVGLFINTLPERIDVAPTRPLGDWLRSLQAQQLDSRPYEQTSLASVQRWSDITPGDPLFESIYVFENLPASGGDLAAMGLRVESSDFVEHSNYPLAVLVHPDDEIEVQLVYDCARLSTAAVTALGDQLARLVAQYPGGAARSLARLELTTSQDESRLAEWQSGAALAEEVRPIHQIIADVASQHGQAIAAIFDDLTITYGDLVESARTVAAGLRTAGVGPNTLVGLLVPRSIDMLIGMLGILQAGGAYVPLDPSYPESHVRMILDNDDIRFVVADEAHRDMVPEPITVVAIGDDAQVPEIADAAAVGIDDYAYVIHTSGSTGRPKGVTVTHRNLVNSTLARFEHYRDPVGRFLLLSSFAFDSSVAGLFWTLCSGGALVLPGPDREHDADHLLRLALAHRVTHTLCLPSLYEVLLDQDSDGSLSDLEVVIVAGEACSPSLLELHIDRRPTTELHNEYGPTEATVWCTVHRASRGDVGSALPIGRPIAGSRIDLLDDYGNRVPPGFVGEIAVSGAGLTPGYLNRPDLTAERFLTVDVAGEPIRLYRTGDLASYTDSGDLLFLGRADTQLKIRGHRIEPAAVEAALVDHLDVETAAVTGRSWDGRSQLVAFVTSSDALDPTVLRSNLRKSLPRFMVPDIIVPLEALPLLPNGKTDYSSLPGPDELAVTIAGPVAPRNDTEAKMSGLWADLLGVDTSAVGADSDYFALGGDSLLAIRLVSAVHREFGTSLPLSALLDAPRLGDFCQRLRGGETDSEVLVPIRGEGRDTVFMIHPGGGNVLTYEPLARHLPASIRSIAVQAYGVDGTDEPDRTVEEMAVRYANEINAYQPDGPIHLVGHSTGGMVAFETARTLDRMGRRVGLVAMLDTLYPLGESLRDRVKRQIETVRAGRWRGVRTVAFWYWSTLRIMGGRLRHGPKWSYLQRKGEPLPADLARKRINHIALRAQYVYRPQLYPGRITYVRAAGDEQQRVQTSSGMWEAVAATFVIRDAPGRHTGGASMMGEPNAAALAAIIAEELSLVDNNV